MSAPAIWWSDEYRRFYVLGDGPAAGPAIRQEPETRFMPADIVRLVPAASPVSETPPRQKD